jgi:dipeptide/tripeptide permease
MMVNLGAFLGPMVTLLFKNASYNMVFHISAGIITINLILLLFYKEPDRQQSNEPFLQTLGEVFRNIGLVLKDLRFVIFLLIVSGFWTMYNQLFFTLPVFIAQWVDTSVMYNFFTENIPFIAENYGAHGEMEAEFITNFDAMFIILFQVIVSTIVMRWKALSTMITGFIISSIGMALTLMTQNVLFIVVALFVFAIGEMTASPKITEYIGRIAPRDKKALYMGYSFIPLFLGNIFAGLISGGVYQQLSDKHSLLLKDLGRKGISISTELSHNQIFSEAAARMKMTENELTNYLWTTYHPGNIWMIIMAIGIFSALMMWLYNRFIVSKN